MFSSLYSGRCGEVDLYRYDGALVVGVRVLGSLWNNLLLSNPIHPAHEVRERDYLQPSRSYTQCFEQ